MIEDFIYDFDVDSIDTSDIENCRMDDDSSEFYDSFQDYDDVFDDFETEDLNEDSLICNEGDSGSDSESDSKEHHHKLTRGSSISFTGNGKCRVCSCGAWAGFGDTCENCGHFYDKHI